MRKNEKEWEEVKKFKAKQIEWQRMTMIKMEKSNEKGFEVMKKNAEGWGTTEKD